MQIYGPVPSRRLGKSIGINNIPAKVCSYACVYCQIGQTKKMQVERQEYYDPGELFNQTAEKICAAKTHKQHIDYLTIVPDGEPTLDINLGKLIRFLKATGHKIAVITNSSLLPEQDVIRALLKTDWISVKIDSTDKAIWKNVNRPHPALSLDAIIKAIKDFRSRYKGYFTTETMLVKGINDTKASVSGVADLLSEIKPDKAYLSIPTRPPATKGVEPPDENILNQCFQTVATKFAQTEYLVGYEGNEFANSGDLEKDLLSITAVHPMREDAVDELVNKSSHGWEKVNTLIKKQKLSALEYHGKKYFLRKFSK